MVVDLIQYFFLPKMQQSVNNSIGLLRRDVKSFDSESCQNVFIRKFLAKEVLMKLGIASQSQDVDQQQR